MPEFEPVFTVDATSEGVQDIVSDLASNVPIEDRYLFDTVRTFAIYRSEKGGDLPKSPLDMVC
jgi:hypothetical protein